MMQWEYRNIDRELDGPELNLHGAAGWELVNFVITRNSDGDYPRYEYIFKRPKV